MCPSFSELSKWLFKIRIGRDSKVAKKLVAKFPASVRPVRKLGINCYVKNGKPYCTFGHLAYNLTGQVCDEDDIAEIQGASSYELYSLVHALVYKYLTLHGLLDYVTFDSFLFGSEINDQLSHSDRVLVYNLTWAVLGYTDGQSARTMQYCEEVRRYCVEHFTRESVRHYSSHKPVAVLKRLITKNLKNQASEDKEAADEFKPSFEYDYVTL